MRLRYNKFFMEDKLDDFKAWYDPKKNDFLLFPIHYSHEGMTNKHGNELHIDKGDIRIFTFQKCINIESNQKPTKEEFIELQNLLQKKSFYNIFFTKWEVKSEKCYYMFKKQSFWHCNSIDEGAKYKNEE